MGSLFLFQALRPGASLFNHLSVNFGVPYFAMTAGLNVLISILIAGRLLMYRRQLNRLFGHDYAAAAPYVSAAALDHRKFIHICRQFHMFCHSVRSGEPCSKHIPATAGFSSSTPFVSLLC